MPRNVRNVIDGSSRSPTEEQVLQKYSPRDGSLLYEFGAGGTRDADAAVSSARRAFDDGRWSRLSAQRRKEVLYRLAELVRENSEEFALLESLDTGKPIRNALGFDVPAAADTIQFNAEAIDKLYSQVYASDRTSLLFGLRRPIGVVAGIVGWNFPLLLAASKVGPALATGNSLVLKPSELTSLSAARLAELAIHAGIPDGVFNVVHGDARVGQLLAHSNDVDLVTFTGSSRTGKSLLVASGNSNMKRLLLECGGKSPNIVFDDSPDLNLVADAVINRAFYNQGQVCTASSRLLVQRGIRDELVSHLVQKFVHLIPSDPLDPKTEYGAVVSLGHKNKILDYLDIGKCEGAKLIQQAKATTAHEQGFYVNPAIFDCVKPEHRIAQEEIFGPVLSILTFTDEEEAVSLANSTSYGLSAILWTRDLGRAHRVIHGVRAGWIVVNSTASPTGGPTPGVLCVGGHKESGLGAEGGIEGLDHYTTRTAVQLFV
jgi:acyl-CoA reductase-like NAD-dependent aldehyde dehydrogenase